MPNEKTIGAKTYTESNELIDISKKVLDDPDTFFVAFNKNDVKICYLKVYPYITKLVAGRCIKSSHTVKYFSDFDYVIEVSGELWDKLNDITKEVLIWHELLHIQVEFNKNGEKLLKLRDHDVKDFSEIIKRYGIDWFTDLRTFASSVYDLQPKDERKVTL